MEDATNKIELERIQRNEENDTAMAEVEASSMLTPDDPDSISISFDDEFETPAPDLTNSNNEEEDYTDDDNDNRNSAEEEAIDDPSDIIKQTIAIIFKGSSKPKHNILHDLSSLQLGQRMIPSFPKRRCGSVDLVKRFSLLSKFQHNLRSRLRVNSLHFNQSGSKLASASYDEKIVVWDWEMSRELYQFDSGHSSDMYQAKFMPGDLMITSCARDGQVRLAEISVTGELRSDKKIGKHKGAANRMSLVPDCPYVVLSAGSDGQVLSVDIREQKPEKILLLKNEYETKIPIYSIHSSPSNGNLFCTSGQDQYIRIFDRRFLGRDVPGGQVVKFSPDNVKDGSFDLFEAHTTSSVFSEDGQAVIGSYSDEVIYMFNTQDPEGSPQVHQYQGHRNTTFLMGLNFYGQNSKYIISGSDCGNIFIWDRQTEGLVKLIPGYDKLELSEFDHDNSHGIVIEPHPTLPVLATSAQDNEVKLWLPLEVTTEPDHCWEQEQKQYMLRTVHKNMTQRSTEMFGHDWILDLIGAR